MSPDRPTREELVQQVRALTEENEQLTAQAEDVLLLGTISEVIQKQDTITDVIQTALEYTCSLKDLAYGSCFRRYESSIEVLADFGPGLASLAGTSMEPGHALLAVLGPETTEHELPPGEPMPPHLPRDAHAHYGAIRGWCCVPIEGRDEHLWMVLADARENSARLDRMAPLIERVRDVVQTRMETLALIEDIRHLNQGLEHRVEERTRELARAYELLKESEEKFRSIFEAAADPMFIIEPEGRTFVQVNESAGKILGREPETMVGMPAEATSASGAIEGARAAFEEMARSGSVLFEHEVVAPDGRSVPVEINARMVNIGGQGRILAQMRDLTERKAMEQGIRRSLEEKVLLLREINHRVKNNMQVAASLIRMQRKEMRDPHDRRLLEDTLDRIQAMAMVYDKLSASEDFVHVDAGRLARSVAMNVVQSRRGWSGTKLDLNVQDLSFSVDVAMPFGLLLAELTAHALGREGTTEVGVSLAGMGSGHALLTVSDNSPHTNGSPHQPEAGSLGEVMVETLREQMQATVEETTAHGTRNVCVTFPLPLYPARI